MSNECQSSKSDSETGSESHSRHAELVSAPNLYFGFYLAFELRHLTLEISYILPFSFIKRTIKSL
jgi:hypothetical protein